MRSRRSVQRTGRRGGTATAGAAERRARRDPSGPGGDPEPPVTGRVRRALRVPRADETRLRPGSRTTGPHGGGASVPSPAGTPTDRWGVRPPSAAGPGDRLPPTLQGRPADGGAPPCSRCWRLPLAVTYLVAAARRQRRDRAAAGVRRTPSALATGPGPRPGPRACPGRRGRRPARLAGRQTAVLGSRPIVVDVAGKVRRPGIATLPLGSRVVDALKAAGGARPGVRLGSPEPRAGARRRRAGPRRVSGAARGRPRLRGSSGASAPTGAAARSRW